MKLRFDPYYLLFKPNLHCWTVILVFSLPHCEYHCFEFEELESDHYLIMIVAYRNFADLCLGHHGVFHFLPALLEGPAAFAQNKVEANSIIIVLNSHKLPGFSFWFVVISDSLARKLNFFIFVAWGEGCAWKPDSSLAFDNPNPLGYKRTVETSIELLKINDLLVVESVVCYEYKCLWLWNKGHLLLLYK